MHVGRGLRLNVRALGGCGVKNLVEHDSEILEECEKRLEMSVR